MPHDDLDDYTVDFDDDPFASPPPEAAASKKRKEPDSGLGIDQEVSIQKRPRVPNVKLDEERLLGPMGIPKLKSRAAGLQLKGKGHEFSDAARLLSFYQLWLDDLFPKARFLDALAMVEKAGHKKKLQIARQEWISQGQPKDTEEVDVEEFERGEEGGEEAARNGDVATVTDKAPSPHQQPSQPTAQKQSTPVRTDVPDDDDLYDVTPRTTRIAAPRDDDVPDNDDREALMAETGLLDTTAPKTTPHPSRRHNEKDAAAEEEEEDLDALIAEAEAQGRIQLTSNQASNVAQEDGNYADDEEAMREMEGW